MHKCILRLGCYHQKMFAKTALSPLPLATPMNAKKKVMPGRGKPCNLRQLQAKRFHLAQEEERDDFVCFRPPSSVQPPELHGFLATWVLWFLASPFWHSWRAADCWRKGKAGKACLYQPFLLAVYRIQLILLSCHCFSSPQTARKYNLGLYRVVISTPPVYICLVPT